MKAVLEVNVGGLSSKSKPESKTSEKDDRKKKKNQVLICTLDGDCKLHEVVDDGSSNEDEVKTLKPIIVTDFNVDPSKEKQDGKGVKKDGKDVPDVPVVIGYKGAVQNDGFSYYSGPNRQSDRLPVYYGMKLSPEFHQYPPPGSIIYEEDTRRPPSSGWYPRKPYEHGVEYLYSNDEDEYPIEYPTYPGPNTYGNSFSGHPGARTPTPYGKYYPTSRPNYQGVITPLHRRAGGGDWSGTPGVYWSSPKSNEVPNHSSSGWVGSNSPGWSTPSTSGWNRPSTPGLVGSNRPGVYWPSEKPNQDYPPSGIVSVHDKMDFDQVPVYGKPTEPTNPGKVEITVDGKLGEPLDKDES